ncbi:hypothetical protein [Clostridium sp.]|uniref:hypothetical protein n=1 Tax=Clostridium sp. TaxID=1506 RepID=UPI0032169113
MNIENFITSDIIGTFTMTIIMIELWVQFTKGLPVIKNIPTRFYTLVIAIIHLIIINITLGLFSINVSGIYSLLCNALVISVMLSGGFDVITGNITFNKKDKTIE